MSSAQASGSSWRFLAPSPRGDVSRASTRPTFAVVIPLYQAASTIGAALDSLLAQTLPPDEVVVCDDGSTDDVDAALAPYLEGITLVRQPNGGVASARNTAARNARSDFVVLLDDDDVYMPERLEAIAALALERPDLDVITTDAVAELDGQVLARQAELHPFPVDPAEQRREILRHCYIQCPAIRRERLLVLGGFDESLRIGDDWDCWIRLVLDGCLMGCVDAPLYRIRISHTSLSANPLATRQESIRVLEKHLRNPLLHEDERRLVGQGIRNHLRTAALLESKQAVLEGRPHARRLSLRVVLGRGFSPASRVKAAIAVLAPRLARAILERRLSSSRTGGIDIANR